MAKTKKELHALIRANFMDKVSKFLTDEGEDVLVVGSQEIALPCVDDEGNDEYMVITFKVPTGSRNGDIYDGYAMAEDYARKLAKDKKKEEKRKAEKEHKIARDKAQREAKAKARAEHQKAEG